MRIAISVPCYTDRLAKATREIQARSAERRHRLPLSSRKLSVVRVRVWSAS